MATVIQIKRSTSVTAPTTGDLAEAELAYSQDKSNDGSGAILYIESVNNDDSPAIHKIGGKYYTDIIDAANSAAVVSTLVQRDASGNFSANVITANEFVGNITGSILGEATSATIATTANSLTTARNITLDGDLEGAVSFDGSTDVTIYANVVANSVELGTDTTGDYVANVLAGTGLEVTGQGGEIANVTILLANTAVSPGTYGGGSQVPQIVVDQQGRITSATNVSVSTSITLGADSGSSDQLDNGDTLRVLGGTGIDTTVTDNTITVAIETSGVSADTYGGATNVPVFTVDGTGRITSAANASISTSFSLSGNTGTDTFNTGDTLFTVGGDGITTAVSDNTISIALTTTGVSGDTYGGATQIPVFTVDTFGRISSASNVSISTDLGISSDSGTDTVSLGSETLNVVGGTGISTSISSNTITIDNDGVTSAASGGHGISIDTSTGDITITNNGVTAAIGGTGIGVDAATGNVTFTNLGVTSLTGTANEVEVSSANGAITIGLPNSVTITNDLTVSGNLLVSGTAITIDTVDLTVNDPLIHLANTNTSSDVVDIGFEGHYFDGVTQRHAGFFRDADDGGKFKLFANVAVELENVVTINTSAEGYETASIVANLTGGNIYSLAQAIGVADGGTGKQSVTTNAILYGQGTSALAEATGSAYQVLQLNASGVPVFGGIDGGTY